MAAKHRTFSRFKTLNLYIVMHSRHSRPQCSLLLLALLSALPSAHAQQLNEPAVQQGGSLQFIGDSARLGIGFQNRGGMTGELSDLLNESIDSAWLGELWLNNQAGGGKLSYHFLHNNAVIKSFIAIDQNTQHDRKLSIGVGRETADWFGHLYASYSGSDRRLLNSKTVSATDEIRGNEAGRDYIDTVSTVTETRLYERAYDYGLGMRAGHHYTQQQLRVTAGLDYEWGKSNARQTGASLTAEKFFTGTPHSVALQLAHYRKSGDFEDRLNDSRIGFFYRYSFGAASSRHAEKYRMVEEKTSKLVTTTVPATTAHRLVKTTTSMSGDAFFLIESARLTDVARAELEKIADTLKKYPREGNVRITGHTCDLGSVKFNQKLSLQRAIAVRDYLISLGALNTVDVVVEGKGKSEPKYPTTKEMREKNRRVDLEFVSQVDKDEVIDIPEQYITKEEPSVTYRREDIPQEPAWVRNALRQSIEHKRSVDIYRSQEKTQTQTRTRAYLNRPPMAVNDTASTKQNQPVLIDVLSNDSDPDADAISISGVGSAAHGTAVIQGQKILYTPATDYAGADSFSYTISDGHGGNATAQVAVTVVPAPVPPQPPVVAPNHPPIARNDFFSVSGHQASLLDPLANDSDPDGDPLTILSTTQPAGGSGTISVVNNKVLFTPVKSFFADTFEYTISDGRGGTATATVLLVDP